MPRKAKNRNEGFYDLALDAAERVKLPRARQVEGLDEEIALLRVRLSRLVEEHPENMDLLLKGIGMLVRAVGARYRLSPRAEDDLYQNMLGVIQGIGGALHPEGLDGE